MNEQVMMEVMKRLDALGAKVIDGGTKLGTEAIRYVWAENLGYLIINILVVIAGIYSLIKILPKHIAWVEEEEHRVISYIIWFLFIFPIISLCCIPINLATLISPTWAAVLSLMPK